jgi:hypothetical protein
MASSPEAEEHNPDPPTPGEQEMDQKGKAHESAAIMSGGGEDGSSKMTQDATPNHSTDPSAAAAGSASAPAKAAPEPASANDSNHPTTGSSPVANASDAAPVPGNEKDQTTTSDTAAAATAANNSMSIPKYAIDQAIEKVGRQVPTNFVAPMY